jgi:dCTP deaminase
MGVLSDGTIRSLLQTGKLVIEPLTEGSIQPASVDLTLGEGFLVRKETGLRVTDPARGVRPEMAQPEYSREHGPYNPQVFVLSPLRFILGTTRERVELPAHLTGRLEGKSSLARLGLIIHATGGNIDPGFAGQITLEMFNASDIPIVLRSGMQIAHISFLELDRPAEKPYGHEALHSHYQGQVGVTASRYGEDVKHAPVESGTPVPDLGPCDICGKPARV